MKPVRGDSLAVVAVAAIAAACCGLTFIAAALATAGAGTWLIVHGSVIAIPALGAAAVVVWLRWRRIRP